MEFSCANLFIARRRSNVTKFAIIPLMINIDDPCDCNERACWRKKLIESRDGSCENLFIMSF